MTRGNSLTELVGKMIFGKRVADLERLDVMNKTKPVGLEKVFDIG